MNKPKDAAGNRLWQFIGGLWIVIGSVLFFGTIVATVTCFTRPLQRPHRRIIDTIEYNLAQLNDLAVEELDLLKDTVDSLIINVEALKEEQSRIMSRQSPRNILTIIAIGCSAILIVTGLVTPAFRLDTLGEAPSDVSILVGAWDSLDSKDAWIGIVVILFSAVFPAFKLWGLSHIVRRTHPGDARALVWLELLGKWSMLDVFVVATLIGAARLRFLSEVEARYGVYIFSLGILASLAITALLAERRRIREFQLQDRPAVRLTGAVLALIALVSFCAAVTLPLLEVEKWIFWEKRFSLLTAPPAMIEEGEYLLPVVLVIFVVVLPALRLLSLIAVQAKACPSPLLVNATYRIGRWAMLDVYALALAVVMVKLGEFANFTPLAGLWLLMAAAITSTLSGLCFRARLSQGTTAI